MAKEFPPPRRAQNKSENLLSAVAETTSPFARIHCLSTLVAAARPQIESHKTYIVLNHVCGRPSILISKERDAPAEQKARHTDKTYYSVRYVNKSTQYRQRNSTPSNDCELVRFQVLVDLSLLVARSNFNGGLIFKWLQLVETRAGEKNATRVDI